MALNYTETFEDLGQCIIFETWLETLLSHATQVDLEELLDAALPLFAESGMLHPQHPNLSVAYANVAGAFRNTIGQTRANMVNVSAQQAILGVIAAFMDADGTVPSSSGSIQAGVHALIDNMERDAQTVDGNAITSTEPDYDYDDNGGDWSDVDAWAAKLAVAHAGLSEQLARPGRYRVSVTGAAYATQGAELFDLAAHLTDLDVDVASPTVFTAGLFATAKAVEDVLLNDQGDVLPAQSGFYSGLQLTMRGPSLNSFVVTDITDTKSGAFSVLSQTVENSTKTLFYKEGVKFTPAEGDRNGSIWVEGIYNAAGGGTYTMRLYRDLAATDVLSQALVYTFGGPATITVEFLLDAVAEADFALASPAKLFSALITAATIEAAPATFKFRIDLPLPIHEDDEAWFDVANTEVGTFQTYFVRRFGIPLPSNTAGGETIPDTLAEAP